MYQLPKLRHYFSGSKLQVCTKLKEYFANVTNRLKNFCRHLFNNSSNGFYFYKYLNHSYW